MLANEEVINGRSERGNHPVYRRALKQWMLRITAYAERLLSALAPLRRRWVTQATLELARDERFLSLLAAAVIRQADGRYSRDALAPYTGRLQSRFGPRAVRDWSAWLPPGIKSRLAKRLLSSRRFVRHVLLDRWFLHAHAAPLRL